jgi:CysZ protein
MSLFSPVTRTAYGFNVYMKGFAWLRSHPKYLSMLIIPMLLGMVFLFGGWVAVTTYNSEIMGYILFAEPEAWYLWPLWGICWLLLNLALYLLFFLTSMLLVNIIYSPVYELVSLAVERDVMGQDPPSLNILGNVKVMVVEIKKVLFILIINVILLFIPIVNVLSILIQAFLVGWDFYDYPMARRGWTFAQRLQVAMGDFWAIMGFGLWLVIPFVQILLMPMACAGGTLLGIEKANLGNVPATTSSK